MSPLVVETSSKAGESSPSTSEMERLPVAVVVAESSVTEAGRYGCDHRSIISASDGDGDGLFCVVSGCEGVSVIDGVTGIEGIDGGVGVIECVSPYALSTLVVEIEVVDVVFVVSVTLVVEHHR